MNQIRALIAEDDPRWQVALCQELRALSNDIQVVGNYEDALHAIRHNSYDLTVMDLDLPSKTNTSDLPGMDLLKEVRRSIYNKHCGIIVLTGNANTDRVDKAKGEYRVFRVIDKHGSNDSPAIDNGFIDITRSAIRDSRLEKASTGHAHCYHLTITFNQNQLLGSRLKCPGRHTNHAGDPPQKFEVSDLARRADLLNWMIEEGGADVWRAEARSIGRAIYEALASERYILGDLIAARALTHFHEQVWLQFSGHSVGLGIPFELIRDEHDGFLALDHLLTRQIIPLASGISRKPEPFHSFVKDLVSTQEQLRILLVGANCDGRISAAEKEAESLSETIREHLLRLGIVPDIRLMVGSEADYDNVKSTLRDEDYHIFHYSGHGHYDINLSESSGLVLRDGKDLRISNAQELNTLSKNKKLRLVYLSSCTSARTAERAGRGDFQSVFEALARADVPIVIGYRWSVSDRSAMMFAETFYRELWRTFSPGEAMLKARQNATQGKNGRDDDTWASPVLLMQNT